MSKDCHLCLREESLEQRVFDEQDHWFAFLDEKPLATGHTVLARRPGPDGRCPVGLTAKHLGGHDEAVNAVVQMLRRHYAGRNTPPKDFLFASLRQGTAHMHTHIVPLWPDDETTWREESGIARGSMFRFLGWLEGRAQSLDPQGLTALMTEALLLKSARDA
jgi:diadenosine tetraphosphate (Ap4A) HIT family hydrolase